MTTRMFQNPDCSFLCRITTLLLCFAGVGSYAQIISVADADTLAGEGVLELDLNGDEVLDVYFDILSLPIGSLASRAEGLNGTLLLDNSGFGYFDALPLAAPVEGNFTAGRGVLGTFNDAGQFNDGQLHYLGLRLKVAGESHAAWMALRVTPANDTIFIDEYAWHSEASAPLAAGQTEVLHTIQSEHNAFHIWPNPSAGQLHVELDTGVTVAYRLLSAEGKLINSGMLRDRLEFSGMDAGLYFIQINQKGIWETRKVVVL